MDNTLGNGFPANGPSLQTTSTWYHLVGTWDGTNNRLYENVVYDLKDQKVLKTFNKNTRWGGFIGKNHLVLNFNRKSHIVHLDELLEESFDLKTLEVDK